MKPSGSGGWSLNAIQVQKSTLEKCVQARSGNRAGFFIGRTPTVGCPTNISRDAEYNLAWCTCDLCATCDFWTLKRDSCIKRYPSGVCPSPARETAPGFSLRGRGAPQKRLVFLGPNAGGPNASVFWPPPPRTPNRKTSRGVRRMPQFRKGQSGNPAGRPPGSRNRATSMVQNLLEGAAENIAKRAARLAEEGNVAAIRICMDRLSPVGQHNPVAFELPPIHATQDCLRATSAILTGIASGDIAPSAAMQIARVIDVHLRAISTNDLEARMTKLEKDRANSAVQDIAGGEIFR